MSATIEVRSPADGRLIGSVPDLGPAGVAAAAKELRDAQPAWDDLGPDGRGRYMLQFLDWILDHERHLVETMQNETGKSWGDAGLEKITLKSEPHWYPYKPRSSKAQSLMVRLLGAHDWRRRLGLTGKGR
jgi:acyl-CoA reductase-like NAD-dependent aldehyde dehydrogenase